MWRWSAAAALVLGLVVGAAVTEREWKSRERERATVARRSAQVAGPAAAMPSAPPPVVTQAELEGYARLGLTDEQRERVIRILAVERAAGMKAFAGPPAGRRERVQAVALAAEEDLRRELGDRYEAYARARLDRLAGLADGGAP